MRRHLSCHLGVFLLAFLFFPMKAVANSSLESYHAESSKESERAKSAAVREFFFEKARSLGEVYPFDGVFLAGGLQERFAAWGRYIMDEEKPKDKLRVVHRWADLAKRRLDILHSNRPGCERFEPTAVTVIQDPLTFFPDLFVGVGAHTWPRPLWMRTEFPDRWDEKATPWYVSAVEELDAEDASAKLKVEAKVTEAREVSFRHEFRLLSTATPVALVREFGQMYQNYAVMRRAPCGVLAELHFADHRVVQRLPRTAGVRTEMTTYEFLRQLEVGALMFFALRDWADLHAGNATLLQPEEMPLVLAGLESLSGVREHLERVIGSAKYNGVIRARLKLPYRNVLSKEAQSYLFAQIGQFDDYHALLAELNRLFDEFDASYVEDERGWFAGVVDRMRLEGNRFEHHAAVGRDYDVSRRWWIDRQLQAQEDQREAKTVGYPN